MPIFNKLRKELEKVQQQYGGSAMGGLGQDGGGGGGDGRGNGAYGYQQGYSTQGHQQGYVDQGQHAYQQSSYSAGGGYQQYNSTYQQYGGHHFGSQPTPGEQAGYQHPPPPGYDPNRAYEAPSTLSPYTNGGQQYNYGAPSPHPSSPMPAYGSPVNPEQAPLGSKSSHTLLVAAGGFAAGGAAGYLIKDRIDARKARKRHGRISSDFADFTAYPNMELDLECNVCDQVISGPYAHCARCDGGDWDVCRECLAAGETCKGHGKHRLTKIYPQYWCDVCDQRIQGVFWHCARCNDGDWDVCGACAKRGAECMGPERGERHGKAELYFRL